MTRTDRPVGHSAAGSAELTDALRQDPAWEAVIDGVASSRVGTTEVVTLARPEALNALTLAAWRRIAAVFSTISADGRVRAVVVRGAGGRAFAAGADITEFPQTRMAASTAVDYNDAIAGALRAIQTTPVPVIAMIDGLAVGGGCELAAACDVRLASDDARFGVPIGRLGVILGHTESSALVRLIGPAALKHLIFTGRLITAAEAHRLGLVEQVAAPGRLAAEVAELVLTICSQSAVTMRAVKQMADMHGRPLDAHDAEIVTRLAIEAYLGEDLKEGVAAFLQRRDPVFEEGAS